jgi:CheY-like chemotaxis protein
MVRGHLVVELAGILVAEDRDETRDKIVKLAKLSGFTVYEASNGQDGLSILQKERLPYVFTDVNMPGMTGTVMLMTADDCGCPPVAIVVSSDADKRTAGEFVSHLEDYGYPNVGYVYKKSPNYIEDVARALEWLKNFGQV